MPLTSGTRVGPYEIISVVGAGGMGEVYKARDTRLKRTVAIKVIAASAGDPELVRRLEYEALSASALNHPNILTVHELGTHADLPYLATEFVEGSTLRDRLRSGPLPQAQALDIAIQIASALDAAHAAGIIHRDVKPENIMLRPDGYVKVLDFGLAKLAQISGDESKTVSIHTQPGIILGTFGYMSPEQVRGQPVDQRADVWSLGVVLSEMLSGRAPFAAPTTSDVIASVLERDPASLAKSGVAVAPELERIIFKTLVKDRDARYQTIKDLLIDLRRLKQQLDVDAEVRRASERPAIEPAMPSNGQSRRRWMTVMGGALTVAAVALASWILWRGDGPAPGPTAQPSERRIDYWLTVQKMRDGKPYQDPFDSSGREIFEPGYRFRLNLASRERGFLYLLNEGPGPEGQSPLRLLFPSPSTRDGSSAVTPGEAIQTESYTFDQNPGTERFWIVWADRQVPELEQARRWVKPEAQGHVKDAQEASSIRRFLASHRSPNTTVVKDSSTSRTVVTGRQAVIAHLIELEHR